MRLLLLAFFSVIECALGLVAPSTEQPVVWLRDGFKSWDGGRKQLEGATLTLKEGQRVSLQGDNGSGKSTLLKVIAGVEKLDSGECQIRKGASVVFVDQEAFEDEKFAEKTVRWAIYEQNDNKAAKAMREYALALEAFAEDESKNAKRYEAALAAAEKDGAWTFEEAATTACSELKVTHLLDRCLGECSGGERKRVALAASLSATADIYLWDEPTNHVDLWGVRWLEDFLKRQLKKEAVVLFVSHDRTFTRNVANSLVEIEDGKLYEHFSAEEDLVEIYLKNRAKRLVDDEKATQTAKTRLKRELAWLRRGAKARQTKSTKRIGDVLDLQESVRGETMKQKKKMDPSSFFTTSSASEKRRATSEILMDIDLLEAPGCFDDFGDFQLGFGARVGCVGANGSGKSSLVRKIISEARTNNQLVGSSEGILSEEDNLCRGTLRFAGSARVSYLAQDSLQQNKEPLTLFEWALDIVGRSSKKNDDLDMEVRALQLLERFAFDPERGQTLIAGMSGGEKRRMRLASVLEDDCDLLVLDEPSNDLDIASLQALERFLVDDFKGALFLVSHDRAFVDAVCTDGLLVLPGDGYVSNFAGSMSDYLALIDREEEENLQEETSSTEKNDHHSHVNKEEINRRRRQRHNAPRDILRLEKHIEAKESDLADLDKQLENTASLETLQILYDDRLNLQASIDDLYANWADLEALLAEEEEEQVEPLRHN